MLGEYSRVDFIFMKSKAVAKISMQYNLMFFFVPIISLKMKKTWSILSDNHQIL